MLVSSGSRAQNMRPFTMKGIWLVPGSRLEQDQGTTQPFSGRFAALMPIEFDLLFCVNVCSDRSTKDENGVAWTWELYWYWY